MSQSQQQHEEDLDTFERIDGGAYAFGSQPHHDAIERGIAYRQQLLVSSGLAARLEAVNPRFDANDVAFLARDLTYVQRDVQRVLYEELKARMFIPVRSEVPRGAKSWTYRQRDEVGTARIGASLQANDAPNADTATEEFLQRTAFVDASYQYTIEDLMYSAFARVPLNRDKAESCAMAIARGIDQLMRIGDATLGLTGFFNNPNVPVLTLANGEWLTATPTEIRSDFADAEQAIITNTRDRHSAGRLVLPTAYEGQLATLNAGNSTDTTMKEYLLAKARMVRSIERWIALDDATGTDVGAADPPQGILYSDDPRHVFAEIPVPYEELPPQVRGFGWVVNAFAKFAGVVFKRPKSALYLENLD